MRGYPAGALSRELKKVGGAGGEAADEDRSPLTRLLQGGVEE
jgi:hypothetical protein